MSHHYILGISAYYHDSSACLLNNQTIIAAAQEERFTRVKHDSRFPTQAICYVLDEAGIELEDVQTVVFYEKPLLKFERLLETYHSFPFQGYRSFLKAIPVWIKEKLFQKKLIREALANIGSFSGELCFSEHHLSHAASAYYPSPFDNAAVLTIDGVGEWATTTIWKAKGTQLELLRECHFPHSLGLLYSAFTYFCGFKVNSGEYKLMGLAPYGNPHDTQTQTFISLILEHLIDVRPDGSFVLNMAFFHYHVGLKMIKEKRWKSLFGLDVRKPETELTQPYMNLAYAIQHVTELIVEKLASTALRITNCNNLVLAGGVALNCVANGQLLAKNITSNLWIQPAAGDAGGSLGAAFAYLYAKYPTLNKPTIDSQAGSYLGPEFTDKDIQRISSKFNAPFDHHECMSSVYSTVASFLDQGLVVGWFQGRMEFGPRALGNRSILGDPRKPDMQKKLNLKIKYREGFRPFAPAVIAEDSVDYFKLNGTSPYMLVVSDVQPDRCHKPPVDYEKQPLLDRLYFLRSDLPAITHVDYSARVQTVQKSTNRHFWELLQSFKSLTGCSVLVNTSFNVRGEPIVCTPLDAYRCFMSTEMDVLVCNQFIFLKDQQPTQPFPKQSYDD